MYIHFFLLSYPSCQLTHQYPPSISLCACWVIFKHLLISDLTVSRSCLSSKRLHRSSADDKRKELTLKAAITTKIVCFCRLLKCLRSLYGKQCGPRSGAVCSGSTMFAAILNLSVTLGNYLQQTATAGGNFRCIFFLAL